MNYERALTIIIIVLVAWVLYDAGFGNRCPRCKSRNIVRHDIGNTRYCSDCWKVF